MYGVQLPVLATFLQEYKVDSKVKPNSLIDVLLLGGVVLAVAGACGLLALMAWQAPEVLREAHRLPTTWAAAVQTPSPPAHTVTPTQTLVPSPTPSVTYMPQPTATPTKVLVAAPPPRALRSDREDRWIEIDLSEQALTAHQEGISVLRVPVSTGKINTPTPLGDFAVYARVPIQDMGGPGYRTPDVRYVLYFRGDYAIHATYWHDNFGQPMSHGCVNMRTADAEWLYNWASIGTPVRVHE